MELPVLHVGILKAKVILGGGNQISCLIRPYKPGLVLNQLATGNRDANVVNILARTHGSRRASNIKRATKGGPRGPVKNGDRDR